MSKSIRPETEPEKTGRTRRQLLAGAAAAFGAIGAETVIGSSPASAGTDGDVVLGVDNQSIATTTGVTCTAGDVAFHAKCTTPQVEGFGILAEAPSDGYGVVASGQIGFVSGVCGTGVSVTGQTGDGVFGESNQASGIHGVASATGGFPLPSVAGVYAEHKGGGTALAAYSTTGNTGIGVVGYGPLGVIGLPTTGGTGVSASVAFDGTGTALDVTGPAVFDRSGLVSITYPNKAATVSVPGGLTASSLILAVMQNLVTGVYVVAAVPHTATGTATINLNQAPGTATKPKTAKVAWFVVN